MIVEIMPQLILQAMQTGGERHFICTEGIEPDDYTVADVRMNDRGNIELLLKHRDDKEVNTEPFAPSFTSLHDAPMDVKLDNIIEKLNRALLVINSFESTMKWTADKPTVPGKYWFRDEIVTGKQLAHVYEADDDRESGLYAQTEMGGGWVKYLERCKWAGPIPEPSE